MEILRPVRIAVQIAALLPFSFAAPGFANVSLDQVQRALELERSGRFDQALEIYREALKEDPGSLPAHLGLGRISYRLKRYSEAVTSFEQALRLAPAEPETLRWLARSYLRADAPEKVLDLLPAELARDAKRPWVHLLRAQAYDARDRIAEAIRELERALTLDPRFPGVRYALGFIAWSARDAEAAEKWFRQELALNPRHVESRFYLAEIMESQGKSEQAEALLQELGREAPQAPLTQFGLGKLKERGGDLEQAAKHFRRAIELDPTRPEPHYRLGVALRKLGRHEEAKVELDRSRELQTFSSRLMTPHGMGRLRLRLPDLDE